MPDDAIVTAPAGPLSDAELRDVDAWWRAANYLSVGQAVAAAALPRERLPELRARVVNVVDLMRLQPPSEHPHGLVMDVIDRVPDLSERAAHIRQHVADERLRHRAYTREHGADPPEITEWRWPDPREADVSRGARG